MRSSHFLTGYARSFVHLAHCVLGSSTLACLHIYQTPCMFVTSCARSFLHFVHMCSSVFYARSSSHLSDSSLASFSQSRSLAFIHIYTGRLLYVDSMGSAFPRCIHVTPLWRSLIPYARSSLCMREFCLACRCITLARPRIY